MKKFTLSLASLAILSLLVACSSNQSTKLTPPSSMETSAQSSTSTSETASSTSTAASNSQTSSNLDGTYKGLDERDNITLVITGESGTWTELEADGEQESKPVTVDATNQRLLVGDDSKFYSLEGNQLTLDDEDRDPTDRIILSK